MSLGVKGATLRHYMLPSGCSWISQVSGEMNMSVFRYNLFTFLPGVYSGIVWKDYPV